MLPPLNDDGNLPPGIHSATWEEVIERFGRNSHRLKLLEGVRQVLHLLRAAGCQKAYLDGSFVTRKHTPVDFDLCWDEKEVDEAALAPIFLDFTQRCAAQKRRFGGEIYPANAPGGIGGWAYLDFFQRCKRTGRAKGILALDLIEWPEDF